MIPRYLDPEQVKVMMAVLSYALETRDQGDMTTSLDDIASDLFYLTLGGVIDILTSIPEPFGRLVITSEDVQAWG